MIKTNTLKNIVISVFAGIAFVLIVVGVSEITLGDLTDVDTVAPLLWCIPAMLALGVGIHYAGKN